MDFTEIYRQSASLVAFSPGANWILSAVQNRLIVRRTDTFVITRTWLVETEPSPTASAVASAARTTKSSAAATEEAVISHASWACDSEYLLAACAKKGVVSIFKMRDEEWKGRIEAGAEGLVKAEWAPDGRTVLCFSEWGLRVTIWSLITGAATYIQYPVHPDRGYTYRLDGRYFVLAERHRSKDTIGVYDTVESYKLVRHYSLPSASLSSISLSPTGNHLAIWEGPLEYKLYVFTLTGEHLATFTPEQDPGLGIRHVSWHPSGFFLAVAGWDDKIHVLDSLTWTPVMMFELSPRIPSSVTIWREPSNWFEATQGRGFLSYERLRTTQTLSTIRSDASKADPKSGVVQLDWNKDGSYLLARFGKIPTAIFIYSFPVPSSATQPVRFEQPFSPNLHSVLLHAQTISEARWNPLRKGNLAACCGNGAVYTWSDEWVADDVTENAQAEEMAECVGVPTKQFETRDLKWAPDGKGLVLLDKDSFCCAFEVEDA